MCYKCVSSGVRLASRFCFTPSASSLQHFNAKRNISIPKTYKAAVVSKHGEEFKIVDRETPTPKKGEVLVKIHASGCCHTDVHAIDGDWPVKSKLPLVPGHEGAGEVVAIGADVSNVRVGDRVGMAWLYSACGECEHCVAGWETLCTKQQNCGYSVDGALQQYAIAAASHVVKIPDEVSYTQAAPVLCAGVTTYKGLKETEVKPGQFVSIIGAGGGLGHLAVQYARAMGMRVIAIDIGKTDYTQTLGAEISVDATDKMCVDKITSYTNGGCHGVLCLATSTPAFAMATNLARRRGTVVHVGLPPGTFPVPIFDVVLKRVSIRGSIVGTRTDLQEALDFAARGLVRVDVKTEPLSNINSIFSNLRAGRINGRVAIIP